jgi:hypothetical protein
MAFTKAQIVADIMGKSNIKAIIAIAAFANEARTTCPYGKDAAGVVAQGVHTQQPYTVTVLDVQGDKCERRNIQIIVYDETLATEQAFYNQSTTPDSLVSVPDTVAAAIGAYALGLGVKNYSIVKYDPDQQYAIVKAWIDGATSCSEKTYRIFKSGAALTHKEVV